MNGDELYGFISAIKSCKSALQNESKHIQTKTKIYEIHTTQQIRRLEDLKTRGLENQKTRRLEDMKARRLEDQKTRGLEDQTIRQLDELEQERYYVSHRKVNTCRGM